MNEATRTMNQALENYKLSRLRRGFEDQALAAETHVPDKLDENEDD